MANAYQRPYGTNPYDTADTHGAGAWNTYHSPRAIIPHGMGVGNRDTWYDRFSNSKLGRVVEGAAANAPVLAGAAGKARSALGKLIPAKGSSGAAPVPKPRAAAPKVAPSAEPPTESLIQGRGELPSERAALQRQALNPVQPVPPSPIPVNSPPPVVRDITPGPLSVIPRGPKPAMIPAPPAQPGAAIGSTGAKLRPHFTDPIETPSSPNTLIIPPKNVPATFPRGPGVSDARGTIPPHYTNQVPPLAVESAMMGPAGLAAAGGAGAAALTAYIAKQKQAAAQAANNESSADKPRQSIFSDVGEAVNRFGESMWPIVTDPLGNMVAPWTQQANPVAAGLEAIQTGPLATSASGPPQVAAPRMSPVQTMRNTLGAIPTAAQQVAAGVSRFGQGLMDSSINQSASPGAIRAILEMQARRGGPSDPVALAAVQAERANEQYLGQKNATESGIARARNALVGPNPSFVSYANAPVERYSEGPKPGIGRLEGGFRQVGGQYNYTPTMSMGTGPERIAPERQGPDLANTELARLRLANKKGYDVSVDSEGNTVVDATKRWSPESLAEAKAASGQLPLSKQQLMKNRLAFQRRQADKEQWQSENLANYRFNRAEDKAKQREAMASGGGDQFEQMIQARAAMGDSNAMQTYAQMLAAKAAQQHSENQLSVDREKNATELYGKNLQAWQGEREAYDRSKQAQAWDMESMQRQQQYLQGQLADPALAKDPNKKLKIQAALDDVNKRFEQYKSMEFPTTPRPEYEPPALPGNRGGVQRRPVTSFADFQRRRAEAQQARQQAVQPPPSAAPGQTASAGPSQVNPPPVRGDEKIVPGTDSESTAHALMQKEFEDQVGGGAVPPDQFAAYMKMHPGLLRFSNAPEAVDRWIDNQRRSQKLKDAFVSSPSVASLLNPVSGPIGLAGSVLTDKLIGPQSSQAVRDYLSELFGGDPRPAQRMRAFGRSATQ